MSQRGGLLLMINELLSTLGFSENETKVILYLMQQRSCPAGILAKRTSLKRSTAYSTLLNLENRGLVTKLTKKGVSIFTLADPQTFQNILSSQEQSNFDKRQKAMETIRTHLESASCSDPMRVGEFEISVLDHNPVFTLQQDALNAGDFDSVFDPTIVVASSQGEKVCKQFLVNSAIKRPRIRELIPASNAADWYISHIKNPNHQVRFLPDDAKAPSDIILINGIVFIMNYSNPIQGLRIKQESLFSTLKSWFDALWAKSEVACTIAPLARIK